MTRKEYLTAYEKACEISDLTVAVRNYINSCRHKNGFGKRIERIDVDLMELRIDLWNAAHDSSKWSD